MAHVLVYLLIPYFDYVALCFWFGFLAPWCALDYCKELSLNSGTTLLYYISVTFPLIMFIN